MNLTISGIRYTGIASTELGYVKKATRNKRSDSEADLEPL